MTATPTTTTTTRTGTAGRIYWVEADGRATLATCEWLVERLVGGYYDEVDYVEAFATVEPCGARLTRLDDAGWECAVGHFHHAYGSAAGIAAEREEALVERALADGWVREDDVRMDAGGYLVAR